MCTRGVWQMERLVLQYCEHGGSSKGLRQFVRSGLADFAAQNPQLKCVVIKRNNRHPIAVGEYRNGNNKVYDLRKKTPRDISAVVEELRNSSGRKMTKIKNFQSAKVPSLQGEWRAGLASAMELTVKDL